MLQTEQWMDIQLLFKQLGSIRAVIRETGFSRNTVRRMLRVGTPPTFNKPTRKRGVDDYADYLTRRFTEHGLTKATREHRLHQEMKNLVRPSVLIIDEVGYLTLDSTQASLVFQVTAERYEKQQAIVLTSNKAFAEWAAVFAGDAIMANAGDAMARSLNTLPK